MKCIDSYITEKLRINKDTDILMPLTEKFVKLYEGLKVFDDNKKDIMKEVESFFNKFSENSFFSIYTFNECTFPKKCKDYFSDDSMTVQQYMSKLRSADLDKADTTYEKFGDDDMCHLEITFNYNKTAMQIYGIDANQEPKDLRELLIVVHK